MNTARRDFLKLGALWAPALVAPRVAYSFLRVRTHAAIDLAREGDQTSFLVVGKENGVIYGIKTVTIVSGREVITVQPLHCGLEQDLVPILRFRKHRG